MSSYFRAVGRRLAKCHVGFGMFCSCWGHEWFFVLCVEDVHAVLVVRRVSEHVMFSTSRQRPDAYNMMLRLCGPTCVCTASTAQRSKCMNLRVQHKSTFCLSGVCVAVGLEVVDSALGAAGFGSICGTTATQRLVPQTTTKCPSFTS